MRDKLIKLFAKRFQASNKASEVMYGEFIDQIIKITKEG